MIIERRPEYRGTYKITFQLSQPISFQEADRLLKEAGSNNAISEGSAIGIFFGVNPSDQKPIYMIEPSVDPAINSAFGVQLVPGLAMALVPDIRIGQGVISEIYAVLLLDQDLPPMAQGWEPSRTVYDENGSLLYEESTAGERYDFRTGQYGDSGIGDPFTVAGVSKTIVFVGSLIVGYLIARGLYRLVNRVIIQPIASAINEAYKIAKKGIDAIADLGFLIPGLILGAITGIYLLTD